LKQTEKSTLRTENISIEFPGVKALSNVNFSIESGKIYALVGANGAGKSTLIKVLSGVNSAYTGKIFIDGKEADVRSPRAAKELGIEIVYQEVDTALSPSLSVAENIMTNVLVNKMGGRQFINWNSIRGAGCPSAARCGNRRAEKCFRFIPCRKTDGTACRRGAGKMQISFAG
jgi:simple sugar transport system ATP-binding protein